MYVFRKRITLSQYSSIRNAANSNDESRTYKTMPVQMITTDDLYVFKYELLSEIKSLLNNQSGTSVREKVA